MKPVHWVGSSREDLQSFPTEVKRDIGFALDKAQRGDKHPSAKPLRGFGGASVLEIVENHGHCSRDPGFDMDMASDHFYTTGSNRFSRGANDVWTG